MKPELAKHLNRVRDAVAAVDRTVSPHAYPATTTTGKPVLFGLAPLVSGEWGISKDRVITILSAGELEGHRERTDPLWSSGRTRIEPMATTLNPFLVNGCR